LSNWSLGLIRAEGGTVLQERFEGHLKKRRDSLVDSQGSIVFTDEPVPPFITSVEDFIWCCWRADPAKASSVLPAQLQPADPVTVHLAIYRFGLGWGLSHTTGGFLCLAIEGWDSPDTAEAAFILGGYMDEPGASRWRRHISPATSGYSVFRRSGEDLTHELWSAEGLVVRVRSLLQSVSPAEAASQDRYVSYDEAGTLISTLFSVTGRNHACELQAVEFGPAAPESWRALMPTELCWSLFHPNMLCNLSAPEPLFPDKVPRAASRTSLLATLGRLGWPACILSADGRILQQNPEAAALLKGTSTGSLGRFDHEGARGGQQASGSPVRPLTVTRDNGLPPLLLQFLPIDPAIVSGDEELVLLIDPLVTRRNTPRVELLQLLNLTPSEARVAALVGSGLPPPDAALSLGLTVGTVRSTLKTVFSKLGVNRQAELVRMLGRLDAG